MINNNSIMRKATFFLAILIGICSITLIYPKNQGLALSGVSLSLAIILPSLIKNKWISITVLIIFLVAIFIFAFFFKELQAFFNI